jgi:hypothetical protein
MRFKKFVFVLLITAYAIYYAVISHGYIKKDFIVEDESATALQRVIAFITPLSPQEKNKEIKEKVEFINLQLSVEQGNLSRYEEWRANAIANPPT